jgi:RNA polymerase sigma-70 factor, ECF subfamily
MSTCFPSGRSAAPHTEGKNPDQGSIVIPGMADQAFQYREPHRQDQQAEERSISIDDQTGSKDLCNRRYPVGMKPNADKAGEEAVLVHRVQADDELAFRQLVERYQSKVFCIIRGILGTRNEVEDIAQQVFTKVCFSINSFDFRSSLFTWIYKITVNECYDYLRKRRIRKLVYENEVLTENAQRMDLLDRIRDPSIPIDRELAQRDFAMKLLAHLSEEERSLIMLKEVEGRSIEELAIMTGLNENTIKVRLFRVRQKLLRLADQFKHIRPAGSRSAYHHGY